MKTENVSYFLESTDYCKKKRRKTIKIFQMKKGPT